MPSSGGARRERCAVGCGDRRQRAPSAVAPGNSSDTPAIAGRRGLPRPSEGIGVPDALVAANPDARLYAEKLAVDEGPLREAGAEVITIDLMSDPRDILASRRSLLAGGTDHWSRDAESVADEHSARLDELDAQPPNLRLRYEDLAIDLDTTAQMLGEHLGVELFSSDVDRPAQQVTTLSATASVGY